MSPAKPPYSAASLMVCTAAAQIKDHEVVFVGMRLPLLAFALAKASHAPNAVGVFENGVIRDRMPDGPIITMSDPLNQYGALKTCNLGEVMSLLGAGRVDAGFIGGAQVDRFGNVNTSRVDGESGAGIRLPGSGGAADIACLARRLVIIMPHEPRRLVPRVDFITSPGWGDGSDWRTRQGLKRGGPASLITTLGVFEFKGGRAMLSKLFPGVELDEVRRQTGWELEISPDLQVLEPPGPEQLSLIRRFDPQGFWTR